MHPYKVDPPGDIRDFLEVALTAAEKAGKTLLTHFRSYQPLSRGMAKEVRTLYDEIADRIIVSAISGNFPDHSYLTEESGLVEKGKEYLWVVDPLDGTSNYANHNPMFAVSIALWRRGEPLLGVIEAPALYERFVSVTNHGAYREDLLRGEKIQAVVSEIDTLELSYVLSCEGGETDKKRLASLLSRLYVQVKESRKLGSAALELAWVGVGRSEGYVTTKISLWDIGAGVLFVKEAGGEILHFDGSPYSWQEFHPKKKFDIVATNGKVLPSLL
ncbi:MAG: inositol monophosphatase family protein [Candidatus Caldarchaeum sp.]